MTWVEIATYIFAGLGILTAGAVFGAGAAMVVCRATNGIKC